MADAPLASRQGGNTGKPEHRWKKKNKSKRRGKGKGKWKKVEANEPPKDAQPQAQAAEEKEQPEEHDVEQVENEAKAFEAADSSPEDGAHETSEAEPSNSPDEEETGGAEAGAENTETKEGEGTAEGAERSEPASPRIHTEEQKEERSSRARHVLQSKEEVAATGALNEAAELVKELAQLGWEKNGEVAILEEALNRAYDAIDDEAGVEDKETRLARFHDAARQLQKRRRSCRKALRRKSEETSKYLEDARNGVAGAAEELANAVRHLRKTLVKARKVLDEQREELLLRKLGDPHQDPEGPMSQGSHSGAENAAAASGSRRGSVASVDYTMDSGEGRPTSDYASDGGGSYVSTHSAPFQNTPSKRHVTIEFSKETTQGRSAASRSVSIDGNDHSRAPLLSPSSSVGAPEMDDDLVEETTYRATVVFHSYSEVNERVEGILQRQSPPKQVEGQEGERRGREDSFISEGGVSAFLSVGESGMDFMARSEDMVGHHGRGGDDEDEDEDEYDDHGDEYQGDGAGNKAAGGISRPVVNPASSPQESFSHRTPRTFGQAPAWNAAAPGPHMHGVPEDSPDSEAGEDAATPTRTPPQQRTSQGSTLREDQADEILVEIIKSDDALQLMFMRLFLRYKLDDSLRPPASAFADAARTDILTSPDPAAALRAEAHDIQLDFAAAHPVVSKKVVQAVVGLAYRCAHGLVAARLGRRALRRSPNKQLPLSLASLTSSMVESVFGTPPKRETSRTRSIYSASLQSSKSTAGGDASSSTTGVLWGSQSLEDYLKPHRRVGYIPVTTDAVEQPRSAFRQLTRSDFSHVEPLLQKYEDRRPRPTCDETKFGLPILRLPAMSSNTLTFASSSTGAAAAPVLTPRADSPAGKPGRRSTRLASAFAALAAEEPLYRRRRRMEEPNTLRQKLPEPQPTPALSEVNVFSPSKTTTSPFLAKSTDVASKLGSFANRALRTFGEFAHSYVSREESRGGAGGGGGGEPPQGLDTGSYLSHRSSAESPTGPYRRSFTPSTAKTEYDSEDDNLEVFFDRPPTPKSLGSSYEYADDLDDDLDEADALEAQLSREMHGGSTNIREGLNQADGLSINFTKTALMAGEASAVKTYTKYQQKETRESYSSKDVAVFAGIDQSGSMVYMDEDEGRMALGADDDDGEEEEGLEADFN